MRIAFVTTMPSAPWGGSEALWAETALRALDAGHEVFVSVYEWPVTPGPLARLIERGAQVDRRKASRRWRRSGVLMTLFYPFRALEQFQPDVVLISQGSTYDISRSKEFTRFRRALTKTKRWPFVLLCHCEQGAPSRSRTVERARQAFKAAQVVGLLSHSLRARSEQHLGIPLPNARLFQNPLNISGARVLPWPQLEPLRFAFVGRLDKVKGLDLALQVLSTPEWRGRSWALDVYGDGELKDEFVAECKKLGLEDRIKLCGFAGNIDEVWRDHHMLLLPSRAEGVPNAMLEAMLCGRPVIVSNVGGISEWVQSGETGYVLPQPDVPSLASALESCWADRHRLEAMGRAALERTLARRDRDPAATLLGWLEELAKSPAHASDYSPIVGQQTVAASSANTNIGAWHHRAVGKAER